MSVTIATSISFIFPGLSMVFKLRKMKMKKINMVFKEDKYGFQRR